ncbi:MAG: DEAD/DEAH box helicase, partial [Acidobacteria bacterium]
METTSAAVPPLFHPLVADWFREQFGGATECQARAWAALDDGSDVLISAPTGSGKTLAAFLLCIDRLVRAAVDGRLQDGIQVVYVSPLKALSSDVHKNLDGPLAGIAGLAVERLAAFPPIRAALRTGDTTSAERQRMVNRPPHILVTTPESLFILLTAERSRRALAGTRTVVVDEIHAVVDDKRGAHLALSLARLDDLVRKAGGRRPQRIGLSATVRPIEEVGRFLSSSPTLRIVDTGHRRPVDLAVEVPGAELGAVASKEMWGEIYDRLAALVRTHRTTLVFVNTRRLAERVAHCLEERVGEDGVLAHHGSLSRRLRLEAEDRLKNGKLRAVVATASLELGIDIGSVDLVCQLGSPRSIAVALQRVGRSGHHVDVTRVPKGRFFPTTRDELVESAALVRAIRSGALDRLTMPRWPRDILAQQIVAAASGEAWREDDLFALVHTAFPYRDLPRAEFDAVVAMLSEGIATARGRGAGAYLHRDGVNGIVRGRRGARLAAMTSGGAIPDNANYLVVAEPDGAVVGTVDEDFAVESLAGDVFLLGTSSWRIRRVEAGLVRVEDARGAPPSIPFWRGEAPGRTAELSEEVARVREEIAQEECIDAARDRLVTECGL